METCGLVNMFKCPHVSLIDSLSRTEIRECFDSAIVNRREARPGMERKYGRAGRPNRYARGRVAVTDAAFPQLAVVESEIARLPEKP